MKKKSLSAHKLKCAISKTEGACAFSKEIFERIKAFTHYPNAVQILYRLHYKFQIDYCHIDWPDESGNAIVEGYIEADDTIITNYDFVEHPKDTLMSLIAVHILDVDKFDEIEPYHRVTNVKAEIGKYGLAIEGMNIWSSDYVGTYHIEQECGEGWITMPKAPRRNMKNYINISNL